MGLIPLILRVMSSSLHWSVLWTGATLSLSLIVAIGAQNTHVLRQGLRGEHVAAVVAVCALLDMALMSLGVSGLAVSLASYPQVLNAVGVLGALVLAVYAILALRRALHPAALTATPQSGELSLARVVSQTLAISVLNPHVYLDTVLLVGSVGARQPWGTQMWFLVGASGASLLWFAALGFGARWLRPLFARPQAWRLLDLLVAAMMTTIAWGLLQRSLGGLVQG